MPFSANSYIILPKLPSFIVIIYELTYTSHHQNPIATSNENHLYMFDIKIIRKDKYCGSEDFLLLR